MNSTILLTRLQLKLTLDALFSGGGSSKRKNSTRVKSTTTVIIVAVILLGMMGWTGYMIYTGLGHLGVGESILKVLLLGTGAFMFMMGIPSVLSSFFASSDIDDLLPLPVTEMAIAVSKVFSALTSSYLVPAVFLVGPLIGWGIAAGSPPMYWVALVFIVICAPMMPLAYAGVIAILLAAVFKRLRSKDTVTTLATVISIIVGLCCVFLPQLINSGDEASAAMLMNIGDVVGPVLFAFPAYLFAGGAMQGDLVQLLLYIVISLAFLAVFILFARVMYLRIVTNLTSGGHAAKAYAGSTDVKAASSFKALAIADVRKVVRTSPLMLNQVVYPVIAVVIVLGLTIWRSFGDSIGGMSEFLAANPGVADDLMAPVACAATVGLCAMFSMSNRLSQIAVSREGSNWIHMKFIPVPLETQLKAKAVVGVASEALVALAVILPVMGFIVVVAGANPLFLVCALILAGSGIWLSSCIGIAADCSDPHVNWGNDGEVTNKTTGGGLGFIRSFIAYLIVAILPAIGVTPLTGLDSFVVIPIVTVVVAIVAFVLGRRFIRKAARNLAHFEG